MEPAAEDNARPVPEDAEEGQSVSGQDPTDTPPERARTPEEKAHDDLEAASTGGPDSPDTPIEPTQDEVVTPMPDGDAMLTVSEGAKLGIEGDVKLTSGPVEAPEPVPPTAEPLATPEPEAPAEGEAIHAGGLDFKLSAEGDVVVQRIADGVTVFSTVIPLNEFEDVVDHLDV